MDKVALDLGFIQIYWYSIFILLGVLFGSLVILKEAKKQKINQDFIVNLIFYGMIFGILGARLYYVLFNFDYYKMYPTEILEIWNGGLAIHGGLLIGLLVTIIYSKKYKIKTFKVVDILVVGIILGQAIGRWGNFFNGEAYGPITSLETLTKLHIPQFIIDGMYINGAYRMPTFLLESIFDFSGFIVLLIARRKLKYLKIGQLTGIYMIWYGITRFIVEILRTDSLMLGNFKMAELVSIAFIFVGIILYLKTPKGTVFENLYREEEKEQMKF